MVKNDDEINFFDEEEITERQLLIFILTIPNFINNKYVQNKLFEIIQTKLLDDNTTFNNNILVN